MTPTIAIDLGTTNSLVAIHNGQMAEIIELPNGWRQLPSVVTFVRTGDVLDDILAGAPAITAGKNDPDMCFRHFKRLLGLKWHDGEDTGAQTAEGPDGLTWLRGPDRLYSPAEMSAGLISTLLDAAQAKLGERPVKALITVPAGFKDPERAAVKEAARIAGLTEVELLNEPSAAAIAAGVNRDKFSRIAVYDLGGGTMDISIVEAGNGHIKVLTTNGDSKLGGKDFDDELRSDALKKWFDRYGVDLAQRSAAFSRVRDAAETAKIELSTLPKTTISVPHVDAAGSTGIRNMDEPITQDAFNALIKALIDRSLEICQRTLDGKGLAKTDIHELILVGGSTRIPYVQKAVSEFFGLKPRAGVNPEEAVVRGAAIEAARRDNRGGVDKFTMTDAASHSIGLETLNDLVHVVIPKGTPIPVEKKVTITSARNGLNKLSALIVQGDELQASKNAALAHRSIAIVAAAAGEIAVEVTIAVDRSGSVRAWTANETLYEGAGV